MERAKQTPKILLKNLIGMIYGSQIAAMGMLKQEQGAIYSMEGLGSNNLIQYKNNIVRYHQARLTYFMRGLAKELEGTDVIAGRLSPGMVLTYFITKTPNGQPSEVIADEKFSKTFDILADKPEYSRKIFIPKSLSQQHQ